MSTDLAIIDASSYPVMAAGGDLADVIRGNLGGEQPQASDLVRVTMPAGGSTIWVVRDAAGEERGEKALEGIIIYTTRRRAFWRPGTGTVKGSPPDCSSDDCEFGVGDPGGECATCPFNAFGSAVRDDGRPGAGKACKESRLVFLLLPGRALPIVVVVSPASLKPMRKYLFGLEGTPYWAVVTRLGLVGKTSQTNDAYAEIRPTRAGDLAPDAAAKVRAYAQGLQSLFSAVRVEREEVEGQRDRAPGEEG